jgi:nuclear pore complex protein Nup160
MLNLYTETAAQAAPATASSIVKLDIPRKNGSYDRSKYSAPADDPHTKDQQEYVRHHLASAGDVYFRESKAHQPRCIQWRITGDQRILELLPVDLSTSRDDTKEAHLALRFAFQDAIIPASVALSDSDAEAELHGFICTTKNEIFHLRIHPDNFRNRDTISKDMSHWCSALDVSSLAIESVFRLHSHSPFEIIISYTSGKLQRLQRKSDSHTWNPENYDDRTWGASLRGIVGRGTTRMIDFGGSQVDSRSVQAMQLSADSNHLFTVCLNHQLRIWHLASGRLVVATDLLDKAREPHDRPSLNPSEKGHIQLYKLEHMKNSMLITFSPHDGGQFKFWDAKGGLTDALTVEDRYPNLKLSPPDPDPTGNTVWSMAGFKAVPCDVDPINSIRLWVLWRNNNYHQLYTTRFVLNNAERSWKTEWISCVPSSSSRPSPPDLVKSSAENITNSWLEFLFRPGLYTTAVLETALSMYADAFPTKLSAAQKASSLKSRLCAVIGATVTLRKYDQGVIDYERFATDTDAQWRTYSRTVECVNDERAAPLSLAFDLFSTQPWIVMADKLCAIRELGKLELVHLNHPTELDDVDEVCETLWVHRKVTGEENGVPYEKLSHLILAAHNFRSEFPSELVYKLAVAIEEDLLTMPESMTASRISEIYDNVGFGDAVSDDTFHRLQKDYKPVGELEAMSDDLIEAVLALLYGIVQRPKHELRHTLFGENLLAAGTLELMISTRQVLWDLLALLIFIEGELNQDEEKMASFDAPELFFLISNELKRLDRNIWLSSHTRLIDLEFEGNSITNDARPDREADRCRTVSILQDAQWRVAIRPRPTTEAPSTFLLTETLYDIQDWIGNKNGDVDFDNATVFLQCHLLVHGEVDLAADFLRFLIMNPWSTYIKARTYLSKQQYDLAAQYFQQCTYAMACGKAVGNLVDLSAKLLKPHEAESFNNGIPRYLQHVMSLFESAKAYSQTALSARLALQALPPGQKEPANGFRTEVLSRLFTAEVKVSRFPEAFDALLQFTDQALQKSYATMLINAVLDGKKSISSVAGGVRELQSLPWSLHPVLSRQLDQQLSQLAKKQKSIGSDNKPFATPDGGVDYLKIVHAMRVSRHDYRGAVEVLYERLRLIQNSRQSRRDPTMKPLRHALLSLINAMTLIPSDEAYILAEVQESAPTNSEVNGVAAGQKKRKVIITLEDLRKDYQRVLDRCARVERGDFDFDAGDDDSDMEDAGDRDRSRLDFTGSLTRAGDVMEL